MKISSAANDEFNITFGSLDPKFLNKCIDLITECSNSGVHLRPYSGLRSPKHQAKLWRQSRSTWEVDEYIRRLESWGAPYIAQCLNSVGPQSHGPWATNALPGQSWHQWGEALDCYVLDENENIIREGQHQKYIEYGKIARALGLDAGVFWRRPDAGHVQLRAGGIRETYSWREIDAIMKERFDK